MFGKWQKQFPSFLSVLHQDIGHRGAGSNLGEEGGGGGGSISKKGTLYYFGKQALKNSSSSLSLYD